MKCVNSILEMLLKIMVALWSVRVTERPKTNFRFN